MTIKFFLRDRNLSNGVEVPVYVRVINGKSFDKKLKTYREIDTEMKRELVGLLD